MDRRGFVRVAGGLLLANGVSRLAAANVRGGGPILVEAGRRVDAPDATVSRFPSRNVPQVRKKIAQLLRNEKPGGIVCAAACGADLLLLDVGGSLHIPRYIVLPSAPEEFRLSSVTDRPGDWGDLYTAALRTSKVEVLKLPEGQEGYLQTNIELLDRAQALAKRNHAEVKALVVWNMESRGADDVTGHFLQQAKLRSIPVVEMNTL